MAERGRITAVNGLRMRDSPRDGQTLEVIDAGQEIEVLGRETWLRVKYGSRTGFVLADYIEPLESIPTPGDKVVDIIEYRSSVFLGAPLRIDRSFAGQLSKLEKLAGDDI